MSRGEGFELPQNGRARPVHAMASRAVSQKGRRVGTGQQSPWSILALTPCQLSARRDLHTCSYLYSSAATCIAVRRAAFRSLDREASWRAPKGLVCASSGELTTDTVRARCTPGVSFQAHYAFPRAQAPLGPHPRSGYLTTTQLGALDVRARQSQRRLLPSAHDSSAYRRAAGMLRDGGGAWACSKGMHLSESVP